MFIDSAKIAVRAGKGGKGCTSFYRDKYTRYDIPDGGDGGRGGDVIIIADRNLHTLLDFQYNRHFYAQNGGHASSKGKTGRNAEPLYVRVPCGTIVKEAATNCVLRSLEHDKDQVIVSVGSKGGRGNQHKREEVAPLEVEEKELLLDLKLIADAGVIGFPNAGKSTLISSISKAHPKVAAYPFTTTFPVLGVVGDQKDSFVIADIPGLIEGSSEGKGLGFEFLRHVERTKVLVHLIDMAASDNRDPVSAYEIIQSELKKYSKEVSKKTQILVANKMDLENAAENLVKFKKTVKKKIHLISALTKDGLEELIEAIRKKL